MELKQAISPTITSSPTKRKFRLLTTLGVGLAAALAHKLQSAAGLILSEEEELPCTIERLDLSAMTKSVLMGRSAPSLLIGWSAPSSPHPWTRESFLSDFGRYPQYVKNEWVRPYRDAAGEHCVAPGAEVARILTVPRNSGRTNFFTNDVENGPFFRALGPHYAVPELLRHVDGFRLFSAMEQGGTHPFHRHGEAWLGQASGVRVWWFFPPGRGPPGTRGVNVCDYLADEKKSKPPEGTLMCVQKAGEIVHVPAGWYHATCAPGPWSVGIGAQGGKPPMSHLKIRSLDGYSDNPPSWFDNEESLRKKMEECGVVPESQEG